jgi:formate dehydrogenase subunit gamma
MDIALAKKRIEELQDLPGALLPMLHALQEEFGYVDEAVVPLLADAVNLSRAEVHGVISFYHDFRHQAPGRHVLKICRAESCQAMGCNRLIEHVEKSLEVKMGGTTLDGSFTLEPVYCLGNCALSPALMLDGQPYGRVTTGVADALIENAQRQSGRQA